MKSNFLNTSERCTNQRGAVFVEAALVFGVFIFLLLGFFDVARMMWIQSQLTVAAEQALTIASTDNGIDMYDFTKSETQQPWEFIAAQNRVIQRSKDIVHQAGLDNKIVPIDKTVLDIPRTAPKPGMTMEQVLEQQPITIELTAAYNPIFPFIQPTTVTGKAVGYREPRKMANMPVIVDCNGNLLGSPQYEKNPCPCPADKMWNATLKKCVCRNNPLNDGTCTCPTGKQLTSDFMSCECTTATCPSNTLQNSSTCNCDCQLSGAVADNCQCSSLATLSGKTCVCNTASDPANTQRTGATCSLGCKATFTAIGGSPTNGCECPINRTIAANGSCQCAQTCDSEGWTNGFRSGNNCTCSCGSSAIGSGTGNKTCQCPNSNYKMDSITKACTCDSSIPCPVIGQIRYSTLSCGCACPTGTTLGTNSSGQSACLCTGNNQVLTSRGTCACASSPPSPCKSDEIYSTSLTVCACVCKSGVGSAGSCGCLGAMTDPDKDGVCTCPNTAPTNGTLSQPNCTATCPTGKVLYKNQCVNPECAVARCDNYIQSNGSCNCPEV